MVYCAKFRNFQSLLFSRVLQELKYRFGSSCNSTLVKDTHKVDFNRDNSWQRYYQNFSAFLLAIDRQIFAFFVVLEGAFSGIWRSFLGLYYFHYFEQNVVHPLGLFPLRAACS